MRYAIYFVPAQETPLARFGATWLGYDSSRRLDVLHPPVDGLAPDAVRAATAEPRRYGFHATLKPPFTLAEGRDEKALVEAARDFAQEQTSVVLPAAEVSAIGRFLALVPSEPASPLNDLAGACVEAFERFRAPLSEADYARRLSKPLTDRQREHLEAWGYPYVFDQFRFHMTLTGPLDEPLRALLLPALRSAYAEIAAPVVIDAVTVLCQPDRAGRFHVLERFAFRQ
ncbi:MAG: DUF1045 domain-containing protein [Hyphomicrobiaceae bacterium]|nr:DUF1045 domain-containing protein [Hyphomicrobiaceae bacterium]